MIQTFINKCLCQILQLKWHYRVPNTELWNRANWAPMSIQIRHRKWKWVGHTLRKDPSNVTRQALDWNPQGKTKQGRPKQTWRRSTMDELKRISLTWETAETCQGPWKMEADCCGTMLHKESRGLGQVSQNTLLDVSL